MFLWQVVVFVLLLAGICLLMRLNILDVFNIDAIKSDFTKLVSYVRKGYRKNLKQQITRVKGNEKKNFFEHNLSDAKRILLSTNQRGKITLMYRISAVCFAVGVIVSLLLRNALMLPVLSVGFALLPMWYIKFSEFNYKKRLSNELEVALSVITSSYIRTDNLIGSVEENLSFLNDPVRASFAKFVNEVKYVDANIQNALHNLKASIDNPVFCDWCDIMVLCIQDRTYKQSLPPIVEQFSDNKALQNSLETIIQMPMREFLGIIAIVLITFPILYLINREWFETIVGTWGGKAILTLLSGVLFAGMNKAIGLSSPIE